MFVSLLVNNLDDWLLKYPLVNVLPVFIYRVMQSSLTPGTGT